MIARSGPWKRGSHLPAAERASLRARRRPSGPSRAADAIIALDSDLQDLHSCRFRVHDWKHLNLWPVSYPSRWRAFTTCLQNIVEPNDQAHPPSEAEATRSEARAKQSAGCRRSGAAPCYAAVGEFYDGFLRLDFGAGWARTKSTLCLSQTLKSLSFA